MRFGTLYWPDVCIKRLVVNPVFNSEKNLSPFELTIATP
jgi:hypothetical protein